MSESQSKQLKCLVVEDYEVSSMLIEHMLTSVGLDVYVAKDSEESIELLNSEDFDVIFMDIQLSGESGIDLTKTIRKMDIKQPKIIACTANTFITDKQECLDVGMNGFLSKPVTIDTFKNILKEQKIIS